MPRQSEAADRRREFTPLIASAFAELGYRGTTTAALAKRCKVRENVLYRTWPSKRAMFLAAVEHFHAVTIDAWENAASLASAKPGITPAQLILDRQAADHGHLRLYRIMFAGLTEDDPQIRAALGNVYRRLHEAILGHVRSHRRRKKPAAANDGDDMAAWALIGLGAITDIQRELGLVAPAKRRTFMKEVGRQILDRA